MTSLTDREALRRQALRDKIEKQMEVDDPVAAYDAAEIEAWKAVPECQRKNS
jgi:hypothetical protein